MEIANIFESKGLESIIHRINQLNSESKANWGKMSVDQMLAHCNVSFEMIFDNNHKKPNAIIGFILKTFVKKALVDDKTPYKKNSGTAPNMVIKENKDFETEKNRLIGYLKKTNEQGPSHFNGKESLSFGKMSTSEWNNLLSKHLDHHLTQFGV